MPRILVRPEYLQDLCRRLLQSSGEIRASVSRVQGELSRLDWEVRVQNDIESQALGACRRGQAAADQAEEMARRLWAKVQAFSDADCSAAAGLAQVLRPAAAALGMTLATWAPAVPPEEDAATAPAEQEVQP